jgi:hypothetical protein
VKKGYEMRVDDFRQAALKVFNGAAKTFSGSLSGSVLSRRDAGNSKLIPL